MNAKNILKAGAAAVAIAGACVGVHSVIKNKEDIKDSLTLKFQKLADDLDEDPEEEVEEDPKETDEGNNTPIEDEEEALEYGVKTLEEAFAAAPKIIENAKNEGTVNSEESESEQETESEEMTDEVISDNTEKSEDDKA